MYSTAETIFSGDTHLVNVRFLTVEHCWCKIVSVETSYCSDFQAQTEHLLLASNPKIIKQNALLKTINCNQTCKVQQC